MKIFQIGTSQEFDHQGFNSFLGARNKLPSDTQTVLKSLSQGDRAAFWQLWMPYQDYLYHRCLTWMSGNITDAQDAMSQATLKAWEQLFLDADKITNLKAWLTRFTHNLCMDIHREHGRKTIGIDNLEEIIGQIKNSVESPESIILGSEIENIIRRAIENLSPRLRSPFTMHFEQDMSYTDVAQKLSISVDNVYKRISQARAILKPQINQYLSESSSSDSLEILLPSIDKQEPTEKNRHQAIQQGLLALTQGEAGIKALYDRQRQCPYCQSMHICKNGHRKGKQNYLCVDCDRQFVDSCFFKGYPPEVRERCLKLSANGMGCRAIGREIEVSPNTVINWIRQQTTS